MLLWAFCFTCSFHKANSVSHNKGTRLHALALPVPRGVTLPDSHSHCSVLTLMLHLITERWNRLLRKDGGKDERNQSWHVNAWQGSVEANIYNFRLSSCQCLQLESWLYIKYKASGGEGGREGFSLDVGVPQSQVWQTRELSLHLVLPSAMCWVYFQGDVPSICFLDRSIFSFQLIKLEEK